MYLTRVQAIFTQSYFPKRNESVSYIVVAEVPRVSFEQVLKKGVGYLGQPQAYSAKSGILSFRGSTGISTFSATVIESSPRQAAGGGVQATRWLARYFTHSLMLLPAKLGSSEALALSLSKLARSLIDFL
jgi:hypothetical protein